MINIQHKASTEHCFLLQCCSYHVNTVSLNSLQVSANRSLDWPHLIYLAKSFNLVPILFRSLKACSPNSVPTPVLKELQQLSHSTALFNIALTNELVNLLQKLTSIDVDAIPFKGPVLAITAYQDISLRQFVDLDLLVAQSDFDKTTEYLLSHGYVAGKCFEWARSFVNVKNGFNVDLHAKLSQDYLPFQFEFNSFWKRCSQLTFGAFSIPYLSPEDSLITLCVQLAKDVHHQQRCLNKVLDLATVMAHQPLDWTVIIQRSQAYRCERLILLALSITHQLFEVGIPHDIAPLLARDKIVQYYSDIASPRLLNETDNFHRGLVPLLVRGLVLLDLRSPLQLNNWKIARSVLFSYVRRMKPA